MATICFIERQKFRQRLIHTGQILHQKLTKWIELSLNRCMSIYSADFRAF